MTDERGGQLNIWGVLEETATGASLAEWGMSRAMSAQLSADYRLALETMVRSMGWGVEFTADEIRAKLGDPPSPGVTGAMMNALSRAEKIVWTGAMRRSSAPGRHTNMNRVWRRT